MAYIVVGDVGGTNTRLQMIRVADSSMFSRGHKAPGEVLAEKVYKNHEFPNFDSIMETFLSEVPISTTPTACCLAVAGPVSNNAMQFTNLQIEGWSISGEELEKRWKFSKAKLVNDFVAQGYGVLTLCDHEMIKITDADPEPTGPIACIGAGTGLGECFCTQGEAEQGYTCFPSEGGHAEWSPRHTLEIELLTFLLNKFRSHHRVSVERIVSGHGLANIYEFLRNHRDFYHQVDPDVDRAFNEAPAAMKGQVVGINSSSNPVCAKAASTFTSAYGAETGVVALKFLPTGGLFICGGIAAKNPSWVLSEEFKHAMFDKGRVSYALKNIPVRLVMVEDTGLRGAHVLAFHLLRRHQMQSQKPLASSAAVGCPLGVFQGLGVFGGIPSRVDSKSGVTSYLLLGALAASAFALKRPGFRNVWFRRSF